jgi:hypothetical protein
MRARGGGVICGQADVKTFPVSQCHGTLPRGGEEGVVVSAGWAVDHGVTDRHLQRLPGSRAKSKADTLPSFEWVWTGSFVVAGDSCGGPMRNRTLHSVMPNA